jgi:hypothetical protein
MEGFTRAAGVVMNRRAPKSKSQDRIHKEEAKQKQKAEREAAAEHALLLFKIEVEDNDQSIRKATEYLVETLRLGTTQRAAAEVVGKSASWVNRLRKWAKKGYPPCGPFSADGKARRKRDKTKSVLPAKQPATAEDKRGIGDNHPPPDEPAAEPARPAASAERPVEQVIAASAAPAEETTPPVAEETPPPVAEETPAPAEVAEETPTTSNGHDAEPAPEPKPPTEKKASAKYLEEFEYACKLYLPKLNEVDRKKAYACFQKWGGAIPPVSA